MSDDDVPEGIDSGAPVTATEPERGRTRRRAWPWILLASVIVAPLLIFAAWAAITLNYSYSSGDRVGYVQKLSKKGWLCKTWEGELAMTPVVGVVPEKWLFSVPDDDVAARIRAMQGRPVALAYEERKGVPTSCFGETQYHVVNVRAVEGVPPAVPTAPTTPSPRASATPAPPPQSPAPR
jgi:hypothetical protein